MSKILGYFFSLLWTERTQTQRWLLGLLLIPAIFFAMDLYGYPGFVQRYFQIHVWWLMVGYLALNAGTRLITKSYLSDQLYLWMWRAFAVVSALAYFSKISIDLIHPNFYYHYTRMHPELCQLLIWFGVGLLLVNLDWKMVKAHWREIVFYSAPVLLVSMAVLQWQYAHEIFAKLKREDGLFEHTTMAAFAAASFFSAKNYLQTRRFNLPKWLKISLLCYFGFLTFGFFMIAGEEISWGQRILGIETPEHVAATNSQDEITIHNNDAIIIYVYYGYAALSTFLASSWLIRKLGRLIPPLKKLMQWAQIGSPDWYWMLFFIPMILYVYLRETYGYIVYGQWEEFTEMVLSLGIVGFIIETYFHLPTYFDQPKAKKHVKKTKKT